MKISNAGGTTTGRKASLTVVTNSPPVANNDVFSTPEDVTLNIPAAGILTNDTDVNSQALMALLVTNVSQGSLILNLNGSFAYTPNSNYFGTDSFTYRASDGYPTIAEQNPSGGSSIQIYDSETGAQSFRHGTVGGPRYMIKTIVLHLSRENKSASPLSFSIGTGVNSGTIAGSSVAIPYASITDTSKGASFQTYSIVYSSPVGPLASGTTYYLNLDNQTGRIVYVEHPNSNSYSNGTYYYSGSDIGKDMRFEVYETTTSSPATVTINVLPVNDPPIAVNDTTNTLEDTSVTINVLANDSDPEGDPINLTGAFTTNGTAVINGADIVFTPSTNFNGTTVFQYIISDGALSATGKVTVTVAPVNDAPVATNDTTNTPEDVSVTIKVLANDSDVEGAALTIISASTTNGTVAISGTNIVFTPSTNFNGLAVLSYTISDGALSATGRVAVVVTPVNDAPVAKNDAYTTSANGTLAIAAGGILNNDADMEGRPLNAVPATTVTHGSLSLNANGSFIYTPVSNYFGSDSFSYRATDGLGTSGVANVSITILDPSSLTLSAARMTSSGFTFQCSVPVGFTYMILASTNMEDWTPICTNVAATPIVIVTDADATNYGNRFYKAMIP